MSEYNRATKPVYWEDVFDIEQPDSLEDWYLKRMKNFYQRDYDDDIKKNKVYDPGSLDDETSVASRVLQLHPELKGRLDINYPDYFEDLAQDDVDNEQNWDDLEKHGYYNYTFDFYYGQHDKWEKNLSDFLKKNNINLENVDFDHFHPEDPSGSIYFSDDGGNDYRMSDHWSESYVPTGTKVLHDELGSHAPGAYTFSANLDDEHNVGRDSEFANVEIGKRKDDDEDE